MRAPDAAGGVRTVEEFEREGTTLPPRGRSVTYGAQSERMKQMTRNKLTFYIHDRTRSFRLEIKGHLCADNAADVAQALRTAESTIGNRPVVIEIDGLTGIDLSGRTLLREWHDAGAQIIAKSPSARMLAGSIAGEPIPPEGRRLQRTKTLWSLGDSVDPAS